MLLGDEIEANQKGRVGILFSMFSNFEELEENYKYFIERKVYHLN